VEVVYFFCGELISLIAPVSPKPPQINLVCLVVVVSCAAGSGRIS